MSEKTLDFSRFPCLKSRLERLWIIYDFPCLKSPSEKSLYFFTFSLSGIPVWKDSGFFTFFPVWNPRLKRLWKFQGKSRSGKFLQKKWFWKRAGYVLKSGSKGTSFGGGFTVIFSEFDFHRCYCVFWLSIQRIRESIGNSWTCFPCRYFRFNV